MVIVISYHINEVEPRCILLIIPVAIICKLPQQLNRRLGTILLLGRHVQIINKDEALLSHWWAKDALPTTI